ncbi:MAG: hypothetical protein KDM91_22935 [Verrucomicrobiae bacterium]|nr:hypothetical protein [Verrucomicrobiae bacterium]
MSPVREILTKTAWWAPAGVLLLHKLVMWAGLRGRTDGLLHFAGGLAIAAFIWTLVPVFGRFLGAVSPAWRMSITFFAGCSVALAWDLAEFASDEIFATEIQQSLRETMLDLANGAAGVATATFFLMVAAFAAARGSAAEPDGADPDSAIAGKTGRGGLR